MMKKILLLLLLFWSISFTQVLRYTDNISMHSLTELKDVEALAPTSNSILIWNSQIKKWVSDSTIINNIYDSLGAYWDTTNIFNYFTNDSIDWDTLGAYIDSTDTAQYAKRTDADHYWGGMSEYKISTKINTHDSIPYLVVNNHYAPNDSITLYISATGKGNAEKIKVAMPDSIALTPGADTTLQENYVYYHYNGGAPELLVSFTEIEHNGKGAIYDSLVPIGNYGLGAVSDSNSVVVWKYNDYRNILNKGMMFINYRLRERTIYEDGIVPTIRAKSLATSEGLVLQSKHIYIPARDNRSGDVLITPVFADSNYAHWDSLDGFYEYSDGTNIGTGQYLWLVLWGSASEDSTKYQLYLNIQSGEHTYKKLKDCEQDKYNMMPTAIPPEFSETGFLICAMIWANSGDSIATLSDGSKYRDLRGFCSGVQGGIGAPPTDSAQVASWNFINDLDTLGAYWDTTNIFNYFDNDSIDWDTLSVYNYFTNDSIDWDTLKSYPDTTITNDIYDSLGAYIDTTKIHENPFNWLCGSSFEPDIYDSILDCDWCYTNGTDTVCSLLVRTNNIFLDTFNVYSGKFSVVIDTNYKIYQKITNVWYDDYTPWTFSFYASNVDTGIFILNISMTEEEISDTSSIKNGLNYITLYPEGTGKKIRVEILNLGTSQIYVDDASLTKTKSWIYWAPKPCSDQILR